VEFRDGGGFGVGQPCGVITTYHSDSDELRTLLQLGMPDTLFGVCPSLLSNIHATQD
jgi:hypothetical protein